MPIEYITQTDPNYPEQLRKHLKTEAPESIWSWGGINLLTRHHACRKRKLWALFYSSKCPAEIILKTHELAQQIKKLGKSTIGDYTISFE